MDLSFLIERWGAVSGVVKFFIVLFLLLFVLVTLSGVFLLLPDDQKVGSSISLSVGITQLVVGGLTCAAFISAYIAFRYLSQGTKSAPVKKFADGGKAELEPLSPARPTFYDSDADDSLLSKTSSFEDEI